MRAFSRASVISSDDHPTEYALIVRHDGALVLRCVPFFQQAREGVPFSPTLLVTGTRSYTPTGGGRGRVSPIGLHDCLRSVRTKLRFSANSSATTRS